MPGMCGNPSKTCTCAACKAMFPGNIYAKAATKTEEAHKQKIEDKIGFSAGFKPMRLHEGPYHFYVKKNNLVVAVSESNDAVFGLCCDNIHEWTAAEMLIIAVKKHLARKETK